MARRTVPTGAERQALFDELSAVFARCGERADAIKSDADSAVANIPASGALVAKRDLAVRDAERRAASAAEKADRAIADAVQAADRDYYDTAQAVDARRQQAGIDAD